MTKHHNVREAGRTWRLRTEVVHFYQNQLLAPLFVPSLGLIDKKLYNHVCLFYIQPVARQNTVHKKEHYACLATALNT
jgi:hypothetical protein